MTTLILVGSLFIIFVGAEAFTNALEHLGQRLRISEGVTGSVFAAIATAMPETMVPIVALLGASGTQEVREEVAVGAILGAPLMLSTVAMFLMGAFAARTRGWKDRLRPERTGLRRDLSWFLMVFGVAAVALFIPAQAMLWLRATIVLALVLMYFIYLMLTIRASARLVKDGHGTEADHPLYLVHYLQRLPLLRVRENMVTLLAQLLIGFVLIVGGARGFVTGVEALSSALGVSALVLSLLIIPVATELPEKVNSILWIRRRRDTLAFGNVTGAMVFQGSLLPALGIMLAPSSWELQRPVLAGVGLTLLATAYLLFTMRRVGLRPYHLMVNGLCYFAYYLAVTL